MSEIDPDEILDEVIESYFTEINRKRQQRSDKKSEKTGVSSSSSKEEGSHEHFRR